MVPARGVAVVRVSSWRDSPVPGRAPLPIGIPADARAGRAPRPLAAMLSQATLHEAVPVPLAPRVRWGLWGTLATTILVGIAQQAWIAPWATGGLRTLLSLGGNWALATTLVGLTAAALIYLAATTGGFARATARQATMIKAALVVAVVTAGPSLLFMVAVAVFWAVVTVAVGMIIAGLVAAAFE